MTTFNTPKARLAEARRRIASCCETKTPLLDLGDLALEELPPDLENAKHLRTLSVGSIRLTEPGDEDREFWDSSRDNTPLRDISALRGLSSLTSLKLAGCKQLADLVPLKDLASLTSITLQGCKGVTDVHPLRGLKNLISLDLAVCEGVSNLEPVQGLTALTWFRFSFCNQLTDLGPLQDLKALTSIDLSGCTQVGDLAPLRSLTALTTLNLMYCDGVSELEPLGGLTSLISLRLGGCKDLADLAPLRGLTALTSLTLDGCLQVTDLEPLRGLTALTSLDLNGSNRITDLEPLRGLIALTRLDLQYGEMTGLGPLRALTALTWLDLYYCNRVTDLEPLRELTALTRLNLSKCEQVTDLAPLKALTTLVSLNLSGCKQVKDLHPLTGLTALISLDISVCDKVECFAPVLPLLDQLKDLKLHGCRFIDLDPAVCGEPGENVIDAVRADLADRQRDARVNDEVKIFVLGNGSVGKSWLCARLRGQDPAAVNIRSNHGVELTSLPTDGEDAARIHLWDFGGQEVYHGSHTLFFQSQAIYLILWRPGQSLGEYAEEQTGLTMRNFPLSYWLDLVRNQSRDPHNTPVFVIQSQCDAATDRTQPPLRSEDFNFTRTFDCSAKNGRNITSLKAAIVDAARDLLSANAERRTGAGRLRVRDRLRQMQLDHAQPLLGRADFDAICQEQDDVSSLDELLKWLHRTGVVYYDPRYFSEQIVLDQGWALEAVYALFDRKRTLPKLHDQGRFSAADLDALVWGEKGYTPAQQRLFVKFMESCGICFRGRLLSGNQNGDDAVSEYVAPDLVPRWTEATVKDHFPRFFDGVDLERIELDYAMLHDGMLRQLVSNVGRLAGDIPNFGKYGCRLYETKLRSELLVYADRPFAENDPGRGKLVFIGKGPQSAALIERAIKDFAPAGFVRPDAERRASVPSPDVLEPVAPIVVGPGRVAGDERRVYLSYAWGEDTTEVGRQREQLVERLENCLFGYDWDVHRDKHKMRAGDSIIEFMKEISQADRLITVFSDKYLKSPYCLTELFGAYRHSRSDFKEFQSRAVFLRLDCAPIHQPLERAAYAKHWRLEVKKWAKLERDLGALDRHIFQEMKVWSAQLPDLLTKIADHLFPPGLADADQDFKKTRSKLESITP